MGACEFIQTAVGKDLQDAYRGAVERAEFECGHDSYNGTISTTHGVALVREDFAALRARLAREVEAAKSAVRRAKAARKGLRGDERWRASCAVEDAEARLADVRDAKKALKRDAFSMARALLLLGEAEKWGSALAIELTGKAARVVKANKATKTRGLRAFVLFGMAAE